MSETTWIDRAVGWFAPERGARRIAARIAMQTLSYEAAQRGRRTDGWTALSLNADGETQGVNQLLRDRARDLVRNHPYAAAGLDIKTTETIGAGIVAELDHKALNAAWEAWVENADADGIDDFYGLQALAERCRSESGECLIRFVTVARTAEELRAGIVPFALRVLEPDHLDASRDGEREGGGIVAHGIAYSPEGQIEGYWLHREHPGSTSFSLTRRGVQSSEFVPASDVIHLFRRLRAGQSRGVTDFAPVMIRLRDVGDYDDAEVMRKKVEACLSTFVTRPEGPGGSPIGSSTTNENGDRIEQLRPAMVTYLKHGEDIKTAAPAAGGGYIDFKRFSGRDVATGYGVPYELMTGDLSQTNYTSLRGGLIRFRHRIETDQRLVHIPQLCRRVMHRFRLELNLIRGHVVGPRVVAQWTPPRFELLDPFKETQAEIASVLAGFDTWPEIVRKRGSGAEAQLDVIQAWQKKLKDRGIVLSSDATQNAGPSAQRTPQATPPEAIDPDVDDDDDAEEAA